MAESPERASLKPTALSLADVAKLLSKMGAKTVTLEMLQADLAAGAPSNRDGSINLVNYAAWLAREESNGRD